MTLDSLPDLDTSGLCLVKTLSTALTCWPYRSTALRDGARTSTRTSSVAPEGISASTSSVTLTFAPTRPERWAITSSATRYRRLHQHSSVAFLGELTRAMPFRIRKLQCDNHVRVVEEPVEHR